MILLASIALALVIALIWQFSTRPDADGFVFIGRFVVAWFGLVLAGAALLGIYIVIVIDNLGGW
jgi:hypothetical protein